MPRKSAKQMTLGERAALTAKRVQQSRERAQRNLEELRQAEIIADEEHRRGQMVDEAISNLEGLVTRAAQQGETCVELFRDQNKRIFGQAWRTAWQLSPHWARLNECLQANGLRLEIADVNAREGEYASEHIFYAVWPLPPKLPGS